MNRIGNPLTAGLNSDPFEDNKMVVPVRGDFIDAIENEKIKLMHGDPNSLLRLQLCAFNALH